MGPLFHPKDLLDVRQVADLLGVTPKAVYQLRHRSTLPPAIKWGNTLRWFRVDIESWLDQKRERGTR